MSRVGFYIIEPMKLPFFLYLFFCFLTVNTQAQTEPIPQLIEHSRNAFYFVPEGYTLLKTAGGDLNQDKLEDLVLVMQKKEPDLQIKVSKGKKQLADTQYVYSRILLIAFYNYKSNMYDKVAQHNSLIPGRINDKDPLKGVSVANQVLLLQFDFTQTQANAGQYQYEFKYIQNAFTLTAATVSKADAEQSSNYQFLFAEKKKIISVQKTGKKAKTKTKKFQIKPLKTFGTLPSLLQWELDGVML